MRSSTVYESVSIARLSSLSSSHPKPSRHPGCDTSVCGRLVGRCQTWQCPNGQCAGRRVGTAATQLTNDEVLAVLQERAAIQPKAGSGLCPSETKVCTAKCYM